jgi:hypothetical protein
MGDVVNIADGLRKKCKAREALVEILNTEFPQDLEDADWIIAALWMKGFVIAVRDDGGGNDAA